MPELETDAPPTPRYCIAGTLGRCRVLSYFREGYFFILAPGNDLPFLRHRDTLIFVP